MLPSTPDHPDRSSTARLPYLRGLDGLRAIAVVAVLLYHGQDVVGIPSWLEPQGGFLGVEVFFVISGYLITALLLAEHDRHASIDLRNFWVRRGRRLLPALYAFLAATILLASLFATDAFDKMRRDLVGAVFYISNWLQITNDESYFEAAGRPSLLRHLWSLAIEEQFYLIWPIVVLLMLRHTRLRWLLAATATAVVASTVLLWVLFDQVEQYGDVSSVYYRTDARAAALLIGAVGAMVWRPWTTETQHHVGRVPVRWGLDVLGTCALVVVVAMQYIFTDRLVEWPTYERLYHGGFLALSGSTLIVIAAVVTPGSRLGIALDNAVFRWVGTRSYGLYLWHWPIYQLTRPRIDVDIDGWTLLAVRLAITVVFVEASYRLIELPIRERRFRAQWGEAMRTPRGILVASATALGFIVATAAVATAIPTVDRTPRDTIEVASGSGEAAQGATVDDGSGAAIAVTPTPTPSPTPTPTPVAHPTPDFGQVTLPTPGPTPPVEALPPALLVLAEPTPTLDPLPPPPPLSAPFDIASSQITIIGDSVVEGAQGQLYRISNRVTVDGRIGRQWWELEAEIRLLRSSGLANDVVVIQLGNNGTFTRQMFDGVMDALSGTRLVLFINVRAPVAWEGEVNGLLAGNVGRYPDRARLIDWYSASNNHPEYFVQDGTHLQGSGQAAFRQLIESALLSLS